MPTWLMPFLTKNLWTILGSIADILIITFISYCVYTFFHPKPTTSQKAQTINNLTVNCKGLINVACKPSK